MGSESATNYQGIPIPISTYMPLWFLQAGDEREAGKLVIVREEIKAQLHPQPGSIAGYGDLTLPLA